MISKDLARRFAHEWIEAWNSHDLEKILAHYSDDFEMTSPFIVTIMNDPAGTIKGKLNVKAYWEKALSHAPDLRFEPIETLWSVNTVTIYYKSSRLGQSRLAAEVFFFDAEGKVNKAVAHYNEA
ncbi:MAG: nuclear transport factor 2 family protein [Candidatus Lindowbacteria bacterium]|nr:nuclear transport factor 2 family protein [Candidatus Lindowbacteria bacterium]